MAYGESWICWNLKEQWRNSRVILGLTRLQEAFLHSSQQVVGKKAFSCCLSLLILHWLLGMKCHLLERRKWQPTPVFLTRESCGQRSLVGCCPWGHEESDMTERLHFHFSLSCIGDGNGNPLQCSCLENSRDGGAWWAAIYGVTQSRTRLKWLSSSSSHLLTY